MLAKDEDQEKDSECSADFIPKASVGGRGQS